MDPAARTRMSPNSTDRSDPQPESSIQSQGNCGASVGEEQPFDCCCRVDHIQRRATLLLASARPCLVEPAERAEIERDLMVKPGAVSYPRRAPQ